MYFLDGCGSQAVMLSSSSVAPPLAPSCAIVSGGSDDGKLQNTDPSIFTGYLSDNKLSDSSDEEKVKKYTSHAVSQEALEPDPPVPYLHLLIPAAPPLLKCCELDMPAHEQHKTVHTAHVKASTNALIATEKLLKSQRHMFNAGENGHGTI